MPKSADPELVKYIQKHLKKGFKIKHIKKRLSAVGHSAQDIEIAALEAFGETAERSSRGGIIVLIVIIAAVGAGFVWFLGRTATDYADHLDVVEEFEKNVSYKGMTDVQLIMLAKDGDMAACNHVQSHNIRYACLGTVWETDNCRYERAIGKYQDCLRRHRQERFDMAVRARNITECRGVSNFTLCYETILAVMDISACPNDECRLRKAELEKDIAICRSLVDSVQQELCEYRLADLVTSVDDCPEDNTDCLLRFAGPEEFRKIVENVIKDNPSVPPHVIMLTSTALQDPETSCSYLTQDMPDSGLSDTSFRNVCMFFHVLLDHVGCDSVSESDRQLCRDVLVNGCEDSNYEICNLMG